MRLDRALAARQLARSRTHAQSLIDDGLVSVNGAVATKPSLEVSDDVEVTVQDGAQYVSRGAQKLIGALDACAPLGLSVEGANALDAGASTGGFTQVLLERGARHVIALDVGHDQLAPTIGQDPRVTAVEGVNVRDLGADTPGAGVDLVVADLSFISLTLAIDPLVQFAASHADLLLMVKPQFEVGRDRLGKAGVVTDAASHQHAVLTVVGHMRAVGLEIHHVSRSVLPGPRGNVEFFVWGRRSWQARGVTTTDARPHALDDAQIAAAIEQATRGG